jgi:hypothetical protein
MTNTLPILAIDIDGPLAIRVHDKAGRKRALARGFRSFEWRTRVRFMRGSTWIPYSELWLSPTHGEMLAKFSRDHDVELVWASLWEFNANVVVAPALKLPRLPWVDFHGHAAGSAHWKFPAMRDYAAGRPLAWLDDSFTRKARQRAASGFDLSRRNLPTLLQEVDERVGVTVQDLDTVAAWLKTMRLAWDIPMTCGEPKLEVCRRAARRPVRRRSAVVDIKDDVMDEWDRIGGIGQVELPFY